jgi:hypothetical protein
VGRRRRERRAALAAVLYAAACLACASRSAEPAAPAAPLVALVSVGGFTPRALDAAGEDGAPMRTAAAFAAQGARADRMQAVGPASIYPVHATLVTGVRPPAHAVLADRAITATGVARSRVTASSALRAAPIWQAANEAGLRVASLDWPSTRGAAISLLIPDVYPRAGVSWLDALRDAAPTGMVALAEQHGGASPGTARPGAARDAVLIDVACELAHAAKRPRLLLLRLSQTSAALSLHGPGSPEAARAFEAVDRELKRWLECLRDANQLETTSVMLVGDFGYGSVHTAIVPNAALANARLIAKTGNAVQSWDAIARSNGGSAFVYARGERPALRARDVLERESHASGAFRVLTADEMLRAGADPEAWFGLEAEPGFAFADETSGELLQPAAVRGTGGYVHAGPALDPGFAAWGRGIRRGIRIPVMQQTDVAPTLARLLGVALDGAEGHALVGVLESAPPAAKEGAADER